MLRYAHTISSSSRRLASRHPMFCDSCTAGPRQFYPLRNNNLEIETNDLTNLLNPNCYDPSGDKWLRIYRVGNIKFLSILLKAKGLTGHETIVTDIPTKLQPASVCYGVAQGRDTGEWAVATYVPVVLTVGRKTLTMSTGVNASKAVYITGMVCYV